MEPFEIGRIIDKRYRILRELKGGSMATVYVAEDLQKAQTVAIKVLREELASQPEFIRRFSREAQKLKRLAHNDIVRIWDFHRKGALAYIVMEYIEGGTLLKRIADLEGKPMPAEEILKIMTPVCNALTMAHRAGIVHCDIKPANIMIRQGGRPVVTDFGIAREVEGTATMEHFGTSAYMSPEQIQGAEPTPQMDIYALGVILFQLVTGGQRPFQGQEARITGTTSEKIRWEQMYLKVPSPRMRNKMVSLEMVGLIFKCLEKDPRKRYKNTQRLLNAVQAISIYSQAPKSVLIVDRTKIRNEYDGKDNVKPSIKEKLDRKQKQNKLFGLVFISLTTIISLVVIFSTRTEARQNPSVEPFDIQPPSLTSTSQSFVPSTSVPSSTVVAETISYSVPLLLDDFSNSGSGWDRTDTAEGLTDYQDGGFRIFVNKTNFSVWANPNQDSYKNVQVEVDAQKIGGNDNNEFGVICRHADPNNYYAAVISSDGYFGFWRRIDGGDLEMIGYENMQTSQVINRGSERNHIRLDCVGTTLTLYANGEMLGQVSDRMITNGDVGLYAGTFEISGTDIYFDDFVVYQLMAETQPANPTTQPTRNPNSTATAAALHNGCISWRKVSDEHVGKNICVYGQVTWNQANLEGETSYIYFGTDYSSYSPDFRIVSYNYFYFPGIVEDDCIEVHGVVQDYGPFLFINPTSATNSASLDFHPSCD